MNQLWIHIIDLDSSWLGQHLGLLLQIDVMREEESIQQILILLFFMTV